MNIKNNKKINEIEEINNMLCPLCNSKLIFKFININNKMILCLNNECLFPMNNIDMDKYIFNIKKDDFNEFKSNIKKLFEQILSNDSIYEQKIKKFNKEEFKLESKQSDLSEIISNYDKHPFFDSFSDNENLL